MKDELVGKANLAGLLLLAVDEQGDFDVEIPKHKVEKGIELSDHVERQPVVLKLSGLLVRPTNERVETAIAKLRKISEEGKLISYQGRRIYTNMLLHNLRIDTNVKIMNGHRFSCTLTEGRVGQSSYVDAALAPQTKKLSSAGRKETENKKQTGVYHTVKRGDTYAGLSKKYGTSIKQLQQWNKYDARKIPVGAKLRVK